MTLSGSHGTVAFLIQEASRILPILRDLVEAGETDEAKGEAFVALENVFEESVLEADR